MNRTNIVTPKGWKEVKLKELTTKIGSGVTPRGGSDVFVDEGILFIRSQNINNGKVDLSDNKYITREIDNRMSSSRVKQEDVLYNITGASIGRSAVYKQDEPANVNQHVCIIRLSNDSPRFINYLLSSAVGKKLLWSFQAGGNREGLNFSQLGSYRFFLPVKTEQQRIVGVLAVWDEYLEKLGKKIELKKNIKKGLMQQLLTGKKRLPGFTGVWQTKKIGDICVFKKGSGLSKKLVSEDGKNKCILYGEIYTTYNEYIFDIKSRTDSDDGVKSKKGDILIPASTTTNNLDLATATTIFENDILLGGDINILRKKQEDDYDNVFLSLHLTHAKKHELARLAQGVTIIHLYGGHFKKVKVDLPGLEEQQAIANMVVKADEEIETLEQKLQIVTNQKKYLLNNLVTGKIRTPEDLKLPIKENQNA